MRTGAPIRCVCCGALGTHRSRGLINACYEKRRRLGLLADMPTKWKARSREKCEVPWCCLIQKSQGLCLQHYDQWRRALPTCNPWRRIERIEKHPMAIERLMGLIEEFDNLLLESMKNGELSRRSREVRDPRDDEAGDSGFGNLEEG